MIPRSLLLSIAVALVLVAAACGGASGRAAWPDVASTDRSADDMGLPTVQEDAEEPEASPAPAAEAEPTQG